jgi:hypothetical protein
MRSVIVGNTIECILKQLKTVLRNFTVVIFTKNNKDIKAFRDFFLTHGSDIHNMLFNKLLLGKQKCIFIFDFDHIESIPMKKDNIIIYKKCFTFTKTFQTFIKNINPSELVLCKSKYTCSNNSLKKFKLEPDKFR